MQPQNTIITVITSTFNCASTLKVTADSIRSQSYHHIQWIVADGNSNDGTIEVIKSNEDIINYWFSGSDTGIYDAWNKACQHIKGEWVIFIGAGDYFISSSTLSKAVQQLDSVDESIEVAYGNVHLINGEKKVLCIYGEMKKKWELTRPALPPHQGTFQRAQLFKHKQPFDITYKIAADTKFLLAALKDKLPHYLNIDVAYMNDEGISSNHHHSELAMKEISRVNDELNINPPALHLLKYKLYFWFKRLSLLFLPRVVFDLLLRIKRLLLGVR